MTWTRKGEIFGPNVKNFNQEARTIIINRPLEVLPQKELFITGPKTKIGYN
jgi:hypothetical protein